jgi:hypothetical protein
VPRADDSFEFFQGGERDQARAPSFRDTRSCSSTRARKRSSRKLFSIAAN